MFGLGYALCEITFVDPVKGGSLLLCTFFCDSVYSQNKFIISTDSAGTGGSSLIENAPCFNFQLTPVPSGLPDLP